MFELRLVSLNKTLPVICWFQRWILRYSYQSGGPRPLKFRIWWALLHNVRGVTFWVCLSLFSSCSSFLQKSWDQWSDIWGILVSDYLCMFSVQFCSNPRLTGSSGGHEGWFSRDPLPIFFFFFFFCRRPLWAVLAWKGMTTLCKYFHRRPLIVRPPRCPKRRFWTGCSGVWHARTMQVSVSWQFPEEVPVDPQGSWSCPAPSRWSCAPSKRCGEVSPGTSFRKPGSFFQSQQANSMFHNHRRK